MLWGDRLPPILKPNDNISSQDQSSSIPSPPKSSDGNTKAVADQDTKPIGSNGQLPPITVLPSPTSALGPLVHSSVKGIFNSIRTAAEPPKVPNEANEMKDKDIEEGGGGHVFVHPTEVGKYMAMLCFSNGSLCRQWVMKTRTENSWENFEMLLNSVPAGNYGNMGELIFMELG